MIRRNTWILLAIFVIVLSAFLIFRQAEKPEIEDVPESPVTNLITPEPVNYLFEIPPEDAILGLVIKNASGAEVEIQRPTETAAWVLVTPTGDADISRIEQAVSQLNGLQITTSLDSGLDLAAVGLDQPDFTLRLTLSSGKKLTAYIGDITISNTSYYVRLAGGPTVVIGKYTVDQVVNLLTTPPIAPTPTPESGAQP